jgi:hypothetical protein
VATGGSGGTTVVATLDAGTFTGAGSTMNSDAGAIVGQLIDDPEPHAAVQGCAEMPCPGGTVSIVDDYTIELLQSHVGCTLQGLADRTPGMYKHYTADSSARGLQSIEYLYIVFESGSVLFSSKETRSDGQFALRGEEGTFYSGLQRCQLADASYLNQCAQAVAMSATPDFTDFGFTCAYDDPGTVWVTDCQPAAPACE